MVLGFDGAVVSRTLTLSTLVTVRGRVVAPYGFTPVAGATVHLVDGSQDLGILPTALDGAFEFRNVTPSSSRFGLTQPLGLPGVRQPPPLRRHSRYASNCHSFR